MGVKHVDQVCYLQSMAGDRGDRGPNRVTAPPFEIAPPPSPASPARFSTQNKSFFLQTALPRAREQLTTWAEHEHLRQETAECLTLDSDLGLILGLAWA